VPKKTFADEVVEHSAKLRGYARKLAGNHCLVDDIVQDTILGALVHSNHFKPGTNLSAWLYTILRNCYFNELRRTRQFSLLNEATILEQQPPTDADQIWAVQAKEVSEHFASLPRTQREALSLVALEGNSYETAGLKAGCACGTMKSRVSRGRAALLRAAAVTRGRTEQSNKEEFFRNDLDHLGDVA
jgi:RNA polymerase sigma-70 factor (ECF subfamily)